jgi:integrase
MSSMEYIRPPKSGANQSPSRPASPALTFAAVLEAVQAAPGLTPTVRSNIASAIKRAASLVSNTGLAASVDIAKLRAVLEKLTPAKLGFTSSASLAGFKSNLLRGLRLAGVTVMPARHRPQLSGDWGTLVAALPDKNLQTAMSRFVHVASDNRWTPEEVGPEHLQRFREIVDATCLKSKRNRMIRNTVGAWRKAQVLVPEWPRQDIEPHPRPTRNYVLPWSELPKSFKASVDAFVERDDCIWPTATDAPRQRIRPATARNYAGALQRAASILLLGGLEPAKLTSIADLLPVDRVQQILAFIAKRTGPTRGGHLGSMAGLLLDVANRTPGLAKAHIGKLLHLWKGFKPERRAMAAKSFTRLIQFDDPRHVDALLRLPTDVLAQLKAGRKSEWPSHRTVRSALFLALLIDTAFRSKNVCGLDLGRHFPKLDLDPRRASAVIEIPGNEVKTGRPLIAELRPETVRLLSRWINDFRPNVTGVENSWLFPRLDGTHISGPQACEDITDLAAKVLGLEVTPHLMRAFAGKIMLDDNEGSYPAIQQLLGHGSIATTLAFYTPVREQKVRQSYQAAIRRRSSR